MTFIPRPVLSLSALTLFLLSPFCSAIDNTALGTQTLAKLELRAQQATPRERCFLYADLLHAATVLAGQQILDGKNEEATITRTSFRIAPGRAAACTAGAMVVGFVEGLSHPTSRFSCALS